MANLQNLDVYAGDSREITLSGRDAFNLPVDLTGMRVDWHVGRSPLRPDDDGALLSKIGVVTNAPMGVFTVAVAAGDTTDMDGDYEHISIASAGGTVRAVICQGRFRVRPTVRP